MTSTIRESVPALLSAGKVFCCVSRMKPLLLSMAMACCAPALAMEELAEDDMRGATGEGIAIVLNDIAIKMGPTSYVELTGTDEPSGPALQFRRGDLRWYGISYTSANPATGEAWSGSCSNGYLNLGCPLGGTIANLAPHDNPMIMRAFDYTGTLMDGTTNQTRTIFESLYPSNHERYRFAFWGEINVGTGSTVGAGTVAGSTIGGVSNNDKLQMQNIWSNISQAGSVLRLFQTSESDSTQRTLGMQFINNFSADIRMSVNQTFLSPDTLGQTPEFDDTEGLYIGDFRVKMATGQLHYQAMVIDDEPAPKNGDLQIRVTQLPNIPAVYNEFYGRTNATDPTGGFDRTKTTASNTDYHKTHGYVRMGDWAPTQNFSVYTVPGFKTVNAPVTATFSEVAGCMPDRPSCVKNGYYDTNNGVFFAAAPGETFQVFTRSPNYMWDGNVTAKLNTNDPANGSISNASNPRLNVTTINLGDSNIQGMMMHSLSLTTLGAGP